MRTLTDRDVGGLVHFWIDETAKPMAALVVCVHSPDCCNVWVYPDNVREGGSGRFATSCTQWTGQGEKKCHWTFREHYAVAGTPPIADDPPTPPAAVDGDHGVGGTPP